MVNLFPGLLLLATAIPSITSMASSPTTNVVCLSVYNWMNNSMHQSPCLMAAYLEGNCGTGYWNIDALPQGEVYNGPTANQSNACFCSSVVYNAVSACAACQGETYRTWPAWKQPCQVSDISDGNYTVSIPPATSIPRWAYQDPMQQINLSFNVTAANLVAARNLSDVTNASQTRATTSAAAASSKSNTNLGAIVGGVIGAVALIVGIAFLTWFLLQRRYESRASQAPSKQYGNKWSKGVVGGPPSRWGGTSYAGGSITGEPTKEKESMMGGFPTPESLPHSTSPYGLTSYSTTYPTSTNVMPSSSTFVPSGTGSDRSPAHKKNLLSDSSTQSRRHLLAPSVPTSSGITPFILPPLDPPTVTTGGRVSLETSSPPSERTGATTPFSSLAANTSHRGPVNIELPSTIEYFGSRRPPVPNPPIVTPQNPSRTSLGSTTAPRPGYYHPDDPSTFPISAIANDYTFSPTLHQQSNGQRPSSTSVPSSSTDRLPFGGMSRPHTPQAPGSALAYRLQAPPVPPLSTTANPSPPTDRNLNPLIMNMSMADSVHTLPGTISTAPSGPRSLFNKTPDPRPPAADTPMNNAGGILNSWSRRGQADVPPPSNWTPHVGNDNLGAEFNPYQQQL